MRRNADFALTMRLIKEGRSAPLIISCLLLTSCHHNKSAFAGGEFIAPIKRAQLSPGISYRNDFCTRQALVDNGTLTLPLALSDMDISVHLMEWSPLHVRSGMDGTLDNDNPGILVNIMDDIATRGDFRWRDSFGVGLTPGNVENSNNTTPTTFTEILNWAMDTYDVSLGEWRNSVARKGVGVLFPLGIADASLIMVQKATTTSFNPFLYLSTFTWWVWVAIIATYIVSGFLYKFIHVFGEGEHIQNYSKLRKRVFLYDAFMTFNQHNHFNPLSNAGM